MAGFPADFALQPISYRPLSPGYHLMYHEKFTPPLSSIHGDFDIHTTSNCVPEIFVMDQSTLKEKIGNVVERSDYFLIQPPGTTTYLGSWVISSGEIKRGRGVYLYLPPTLGCEYELEQASTTFYQSPTGSKGFSEADCPIGAPIGSIQLIQQLNLDPEHVRIMDALFHYFHFKFATLYAALPDDLKAPIHNKMVKWTTSISFISMFLESKPEDFIALVSASVRACNYFNQQLRDGAQLNFKTLTISTLLKLISRFVTVSTLPPVPTIQLARKAYKRIEFAAIQDSLPPRGETLELPRNLDEWTLIQAVYSTIIYDIAKVEKQSGLPVYLKSMISDLVSIQALVGPFATQSVELSSDVQLIHRIIQACELACSVLNLDYRKVSAATFLQQSILDQNPVF